MNNSTKSLLKKCGIPPHLLGYEYAGAAIELIHADRKYLHSVTTSLYPRIAKKFNTTPSRVERAIRHAIEVAFTNNISPDNIEEVFGNTISLEVGKPTNAQFLATLADMLDD